jgi:hypothetical protein
MRRSFAFAGPVAAPLVSRRLGETWDNAFPLQNAPLRFELKAAVWRFGPFHAIRGEFMKRFVKAVLSVVALSAVCLLAASAHAGTEPPDPCSLLTPAQVGSVMSATYTAAAKSAAPPPFANTVSGTDCRYSGRNPLWFRIYYDGSASDATTLFAKLKVLYSPTTPVSGIGDEAYFDKSGALHARKSNVRFYIDIGTSQQQARVTQRGQIVAGQL